VHFLFLQLGFLQIGDAITATPLLSVLACGGGCLFFSSDGAVVEAWTLLVVVGSRSRTVVECRRWLLPGSGSRFATASLWFRGVQGA